MIFYNFCQCLFYVTFASKKLRTKNYKLKT